MREDSVHTTSARWSCSLDTLTCCHQPWSSVVVSLSLYFYVCLLYPGVGWSREGQLLLCILSLHLFFSLIFPLVKATTQTLNH
ncbi:uncharacterized protein BP01DRAFT_18460 [Aspergillus saccharolyticus JOP 1030-1]|uniref:Uncharacterized protein n=1 Tax=Aspergillus saccharolyticus JOP 1030-1 TaxID=1450539 RepID=A0A318ZQE4_9EURO|nr:hypothetical protein BP01DRAFT_18460 [Aspergillus saccharolyticus JOP 1030-1]PYH46623.1 hypothetical protein BP01DRAFT_18460 [Aspergillus saccharolyticus JOP 1030-1]